MREQDYVIKSFVFTTLHFMLQTFILPKKQIEFKFVRTVKIIKK